MRRKGVRRHVLSISKGGKKYLETEITRISTLTQGKTSSIRGKAKRAEEE